MEYDGSRVSDFCNLLDSLPLTLLGFKRNEILLRDYSSRSSPRTTEGRGVIPVFRIQATLGKHPRVFLVGSREKS
jgi:hypothetical protein